MNIITKMTAKDGTILALANNKPRQPNPTTQASSPKHHRQK